MHTWYFFTSLFSSILVFRHFFRTIKMYQVSFSHILIIAKRTTTCCCEAQHFWKINKLIFIGFLFFFILFFFAYLWSANCFCSTKKVDWLIYLFSRHSREFLSRDLFLPPIPRIFIPGFNFLSASGKIVVEKCLTRLF